MMMYLSNIEKFFKNDSENLYLKFIRSEQALLKFIAFYSLERLKKKIFYYLLITKKIPDSTKARKHYELLL